MENYLNIKVSSLRYSLGQSRADFARAMNVDLQTVFAWEHGEKSPNSSQISKMVRLSQQSEAYAERTSLRPAMDLELKRRHLSQIHAEQVVVQSAPLLKPSLNRPSAIS
jgi:transcriptional regulator with XRE-family HTH domain